MPLPGYGRNASADQIGRELPRLNIFSTET